MAAKSMITRSIGQVPSFGLSPVHYNRIGILVEEVFSSRSSRVRCFSSSSLLSRDTSASLATGTMSTTTTTTRTSKTITRLRSEKSQPVVRTTAHNQAINRKPLQDLSSLSRIPKHSWDSHMHVVDPAQYPLSPKAAYTPHAHYLVDALKFESSVALANIVLVQPSIYGNDNSCMLDALKTIGPQRGRAVVGLDPATIDQETLKDWHKIGVRGVRLNLKSVRRDVVEAELQAELRQYANVIRPFDWVLELFIGLESMPILERLVPDLGVKICVAHFGAPNIPQAFDSTSQSPYSLPGFQSLVNLLKGGKTWVKLSAPYRFAKDEDQKDIDVFGRELLKVAGHRAVFATDWPHTRFEGVDIKPFTRKCLEWCGDDDDLVYRLFRSNAEELWDVAK